MSKLLQQFEDDVIANLSKDKEIVDFAPGDTIKVHVSITEGANERVQVFTGICIARKNRGLNSSFTVRKISHGEGVERTFPLYSPKVANIELVRRGVVRRAKLYYMRNLRGKAARIKEKMDFNFSKNKDANKAPKKDDTSKNTTVKSESKSEE